ncbi:cucumber peeling cupredoxin-like [Salvia miltiorrhiza]|uniref:cucumber peeling cupredoxin-like n=1 Tax=Salvia miltiorrhiza TaxID=226208 RepID=UPI0025AB7382|nr:cucumber peeling cupredoxin-like [Salvia miltiorrhiza]
MTRLRLRMAAAFNLLVVALTLAGAGVSAETHHVVGGDGGWGPDFNATAWLFGRLFTVGDKLRFEYAGGDEKIVEVGGAKEFETCNLTNPIRMLTDPVSHVALEEEGVRYFTSADPESCRKGLKLPVTVTVTAHDFDPSPPYDPYYPDVPSPPYHPDLPSPPYEPYEVPPPPHKPHPSLSAPARLNGGLCLLLAAAVWVYCVATF